MYHHIGWLDPTAGKEWYVTTVTPIAFEQQMAYLVHNGYRTIRIRDLIAAGAGRKRLPKKPVVITFDDGWIDCYERAFPVLQKYGMTATFFLNAGAIGAAEASTMNWAQVVEMSKAGMENGSHSMSHPELTKLDPNTLAWELKNSKAVIEQHVGKTVEAFAYPFGLYDSNVLRQTQAAGYRAAVTVADGVFDTSANWLEMPRQYVSYSANLNAFLSLLGEKSPQ